MINTLHHVLPLASFIVVVPGGGSTLAGSAYPATRETGAEDIHLRLQTRDTPRVVGPVVPS